MRMTSQKRKGYLRSRGLRRARYPGQTSAGQNTVLLPQVLPRRTLHPTHLSPPIRASPEKHRERVQAASRPRRTYQPATSMRAADSRS
jgi:hypothetical protein